MKRAREDEGRNAYGDSIARRNKTMRAMLGFDESYLPSPEKPSLPSAAKEKPDTTPTSG
jgi:hypothetical protein